MHNGTPFKEQLRQRKPLMGTFVKTPSPIIVEVLADSGLDFLILDAEHAPFGREALDLCIMAARLKNCPVLVRTSDMAPASILNALDLGATGVVVPHLTSAEQARDLVKACHYGAGGRGYAGSSRAAGYGTVPIANHLANSAAQTVIIGQIEDPAAVEAIEEIAAEPGLDCLFIGRVDLTVGYGATNQQDPAVEAAVHRICDAAEKADRALGMFLPNMKEVPRFSHAGVSLYAVASEHQMIRDGFRTFLDSAEWHGAVND